MSRYVEIPQLLRDLASAKAEIERLRGLLREGAEYPGSTQWLWRVREALGDVSD